MLVINERTTAPRSEQRVLDWMRSWTGQYVIVGLAISGCYLPDRERRDETQEADLVVITPRAAVVVEVKGTVPEATSGVLSVQANGRWRLSGYAGDPIHVRDHDSSPFDQVTNNVFNLKALVRKHNADAFVDGLIVLVPPKDSNLTLNIESRRRGCAVVLGAGQADLRAWFHRTASRKLIWTAERTHALLTDLNLGDQVTVDDLAADGFPPEQKLRAGMLAALESVTRKAPELGGGTSSEDSGTDDVSAGSDAPPVYAAPEPHDLDPDAALLSESGATRTTENGDEADEVYQQFPEVDQSPASQSALPALEQADASGTVAAQERPARDVEEHEGSEFVPSTRPSADSAQRAQGASSTARQSLECTDVPGGSQKVSASESHSSQALVAVAAQAQPAQTDPFAPEYLAPEPESHPAPSDPTTHADLYARKDDHRSASSLADAPPLDSDVLSDEHAQPPRFEGRLAAKPSREELAEPYADATGRFTTGFGPSTRPATAESNTMEPTDFEFPPGDEEFAPDARSAPAPSSFTDNWSSWIEPAADRPRRPRPVQAPPPSRPASWSTPTPAPEPLRRPTPTAVLERRPRVPVREQITALSARIPGRTSEKSKPRGHRSQQIAAVALIALVIGTIWILAASCSTPTGGAVQPTQAPVLTTEAVPPPPPVTETPARMNLLPLCTPRTPKC
ncbi:NERD domain-containing protein [Nocardia sp. NPDC057455]|uniref:NERD domain-containing protein n=1 Tax=Nocardia sp. NPDC057455 TaxID=3346138 RepID=UPI003671AEDF